MFVNKPAYRLRKNQHHQNHQHNGNNHHRNMLRHADRGNYRVETEDDVDEHYLHDRRHKRCSRLYFALAFSMTLNLLVDLDSALVEQEETTEQ
jgi:hypothetical protein